MYLHLYKFVAPDLFQIYQQHNFLEFFTMNLQVRRASENLFPLKCPFKFSLLIGSADACYGSVSKVWNRGVRSGEMREAQEPGICSFAEAKSLKCVAGARTSTRQSPKDYANYMCFRGYLAAGCLLASNFI